MLRKELRGRAPVVVSAEVSREEWLVDPGQLHSYRTLFDVKGVPTLAVYSVAEIERMKNSDDVLGIKATAMLPCAECADQESVNAFLGKYWPTVLLHKGEYIWVHEGNWQKVLDALHTLDCSLRDTLRCAEIFSPSFMCTDRRATRNRSTRARATRRSVSCPSPPTSSTSATRLVRHLAALGPCLVWAGLGRVRFRQTLAHSRRDSPLPPHSRRRSDKNIHRPRHLRRHHLPRRLHTPWVRPHMTRAAVRTSPLPPATGSRTRPRAKGSASGRGGRFAIATMHQALHSHT